MTVQLKITKENGEEVVVDDDVTLTNNPLYSCFSQVQVSLNGAYVNSDVGAHYGF